ncbi:glycosyltransferase [Afifella aestuarii]|uniref:glycosyltransferase n=1 Tax=Afifella aestuarii TaxID=1909496 RepID=UPI000FE3267F|nr:glycosyltransferase family 2 protein [Afifella aestuarii]
MISDPSTTGGRSGKARGIGFQERGVTNEGMERVDGGANGRVETGSAERGRAPSRADLARHVTLVTVAYNSAEALRWQGAHSARLPGIVVDNGSSDATRAAARERGLGILAFDVNCGFGRGVMAGLAAVTTEFALVINPDAAMSEDGVAALLAAAERYPDCALFVPRIVNETGKVFFRVDSALEPRQKHRRPPEGDACIAMLSGAVMLVRVAPFLAFGGFDPAIFLYFEDDELAFRYRAARRPIIYVPEAEAVHLGNRSSGPSARPAAKSNRVKDISFGWSHAYVMEKTGRDSGRSVGRRSRALAVLRLAGSIAVCLVSGRFGKLRREAYRLKGFVRRLRGRPAPFLPPGEPECVALDLSHGKV